MRRWAAAAFGTAILAACGTALPDVDDGSSGDGGAADSNAPDAASMRDAPAAGDADDGGNARDADIDRRPPGAVYFEDFEARSIGCGNLQATGSTVAIAQPTGPNETKSCKVCSTGSRNAGVTFTVPTAGKGTYEISILARRDVDPEAGTVELYVQILPKSDGGFGTDSVSTRQTLPSAWTAFAAAGPIDEPHDEIYVEMLAFGSYDGFCFKVDEIGLAHEAL